MTTFYDPKGKSVREMPFQGVLEDLSSDAWVARLHGKAVQVEHIRLTLG